MFGSVARGQARPDSDVDFLVEMEAGRTVLDLSELILDLEEALDREVDELAVSDYDILARRNMCSLSFTRPFPARTLGARERVSLSCFST